MTEVRALAALSAGEPLAPITIDRRAVGESDVDIEIAYSGVCHSDIHQARSEWGAGIFPMVPGHEIVGTVAAVGSEVTKYAVGDRVGVGVIVDSCRECANCRANLEQHCSESPVFTYNALGRDGEPTLGGYARSIVVDERFVHRIPDGLALDVAAPLLCAGITVYSPLKRWGAGPGKEVAVLGMGGLGHLAVLIARAMGARVTVLSHSMKKRDDAMRLGADAYYDTSDRQSFRDLRASFDLIISTVSADLRMDSYLALLRTFGVLVNVGAPLNPLSISPFSLIAGGNAVAGSSIGGTTETQEMLDFCAQHGIGAEIELINANDINEAFERVVASDVRYRCVIDASTI